MADDIILNPISSGGGDTIAADDISGIKYPRQKITIGADGVNDGDVSASNPMPVTTSIDAGAGRELLAATEAVLEQLLLLNARIEEAFQTGITLEDLHDG
jgi:hypothetical protein